MKTVFEKSLESALLIIIKVKKFKINKNILNCKIRHNKNKI